MLGLVAKGQGCVTGLVLSTSAGGWNARGVYHEAQVSDAGKGESKEATERFVEANVQACRYEAWDSRHQALLRTFRSLPNHVRPRSARRSWSALQGIRLTASPSRSTWTLRVYPARSTS